MIFSLDIRRARQGDCLLIHYGSRTNPGLMVIDGGPAQVYRPQLKPRLARIRQARDLMDSQPLPIDLLVVSHIDDDHVRGLLELTGELVAARESQEPLPFKIRSFWHNTFDDILGNDPEDLRAAVTAVFGAASLSGGSEAEGLDPDTALVLAGIDQSFRLRDDARKLKVRINPEFRGRLVQATGKNKSIELGRGLRLTVAGPMKAELLNLQKEHDAFLKKKKRAKNTIAALASLTDTSVPNLSSLVLLAEAGKKRILLTGDARGDKIVQGLELAGLLKKNAAMHVDILKMPHHGSDRNVEPAFFQRITADHYVFSGNGGYGNPERATLQMLLDARGDEAFTVHLTYPVGEIDANRKKDWQGEQQKEKNRQKSNPNLKVRANWSPRKHSLSSFLAANREFARKVSIVQTDRPYIIDLLETLGF